MDLERNELDPADGRTAVDGEELGATASAVESTTHPAAGTAGRDGGRPRRLRRRRRTLSRSSDLDVREKGKESLIKFLQFTYFLLLKVSP
jgi:hypothetical protein